MQKDRNLHGFFADLHIHIGATRTGRPVKITGSRKLTLANILYEAKHKKGMDMIGIIDCHSPEVLADLKQMVADGILVEQQGGGLDYDGLVLILGTETEIYDDQCKGPIHVLTFLPDVPAMEKHSKWLEKRVKNIHLSSQRMYGTAIDLQAHVKKLGGIFIPAHIFTPFKSLYGKGVTSTLNEVFDPHLIDAVELGLSSNTRMASHVEELASYTFLTNSDAHSLEKMAREYQLLEMEKPTFEELKLTLQQKEGRRVIANYGLNPYLGKYFSTVCESCLTPHEGATSHSCRVCGKRKFVKGVHDRILELQGNYVPDIQDRPPYIHQIPLEFIPGLGPKTLDKLREAFGTDMDIIHSVPLERLRHIVKPAVADRIHAARNGDLAVQKGGGGSYGKVRVDKPSNS
jgi:uncharacterized protein (TIGR00375 family)